MEAFLVCLLCLIAMVTGAPSPLQMYHGHHVLRIIPATEKQLHDVGDIIEQQDELGLDVWTKPKSVNVGVDIRVPKLSVDHVTKVIKDKGLKYEILVDDLQKEIDKEAESLEHSRRKRRVDKSGFNLKTFNRIDDINNWLNNIIHDCGNICSRLEIGRSYENRPLTVIKIGTPHLGVTKPAVWMDAGFHAREWIAPATALQLIHKLITYRNNANVRALLDRYDFYIMPVANPDGYAYTWTRQGRMWRKTRSSVNDYEGTKYWGNYWKYMGTSDSCNGVDPNRNFDYKWRASGTSRDPCSEIYGGPVAFSEVETQAVKNFILQEKKNIKMYVSLHSYGQYWLTSWGWTRSYPDDYNTVKSIAQKGADAIHRSNNGRGDLYRVGAAGAMLYPAAGGSDDWAKGVAGIKYSYTIELSPSNGGRNGFIISEHYIQPVADEVFDGLMAAVKQLT